jgi:hypothetical protein
MTDGKRHTGDLCLKVEVIVDGKWRLGSHIDFEALSSHELVEDVGVELEIHDLLSSHAGVARDEALFIEISRISELVRNSYVCVSKS